ncbi:hypothetical protein BDV12DRAFT_160120 [Aspergillus spectabilis]
MSKFSHFSLTSLPASLVLVPVNLFTTVQSSIEIHQKAQANMPMTWNAEAEAKLFLGVLDQVRGAKLDYKALAAFMGPNCSVAALQQKIFRLRREAGTPVSSPAKTCGVQTPATGTLKKRKLARSPETPTKKGKGSACDLDAGECGEGEGESDIKPIIKKEDEKKLNFGDLAG